MVFFQLLNIKISLFCFNNKYEMNIINCHNRGYSILYVSGKCLIQVAIIGITLLLETSVKYVIRKLNFHF